MQWKILQAYVLIATSSAEYLIRYEQPSQKLLPRDHYLHRDLYDPLLARLATHQEPLGDSSRRPKQALDGSAMQLFARALDKTSSQSNESPDIPSSNFNEINRAKSESDTHSMVPSFEENQINRPKSIFKIAKQVRETLGLSFSPKDSTVVSPRGNINHLRRSELSPSSRHSNDPYRGIAKQAYNILKETPTNNRRMNSKELDLLEQGLFHHAPHQEPQTVPQKALLSKSTLNKYSTGKETSKAVDSKLQKSQGALRHWVKNPRTYATAAEYAGYLATLKGTTYQEPNILFGGLGARVVGAVANKVMDSNEKIKKAREERKRNDKGQKHNSGQQDTKTGNHSKQNKDVSTMVRRNFDDPA